MTWDPASLFSVNKPVIKPAKDAIVNDSTTPSAAGNFFQFASNIGLVGANYESYVLHLLASKAEGVAAKIMPDFERFLKTMDQTVVQKWAMADGEALGAISTDRCEAANDFMVKNQFSPMFNPGADLYLAVCSYFLTSFVKKGTLRADEKGRAVALWMAGNNDTDSVYVVESDGKLAFNIDINIQGGASSKKFGKNTKCLIMSLPEDVNGDNFVAVNNFAHGFIQGRKINVNTDFMKHPVLIPCYGTGDGNGDLSSMVGNIYGDNGLVTQAFIKGITGFGHKGAFGKTIAGAEVTRGDRDAETFYGIKRPIFVFVDEMCIYAIYNPAESWMFNAKRGEMAKMILDGDTPEGSIDTRVDRMIHIS